MYNVVGYAGLGMKNVRDVGEICHLVLVKNAS